MMLSKLSPTDQNSRSQAALVEQNSDSVCPPTAVSPTGTGGSKTPSRGAPTPLAGGQGALLEPGSPVFDDHSVGFEGSNSDGYSSESNRDLYEKMRMQPPLSTNASPVNSMERIFRPAIGGVGATRATRGLQSQAMSLFRRRTPSDAVFLLRSLEEFKANQGKLNASEAVSRPSDHRGKAAITQKNDREQHKKTQGLDDLMLCMETDTPGFDELMFLTQEHSRKRNACIDHILRPHNRVELVREASKDPTGPNARDSNFLMNHFSEIAVHNSFQRLSLSQQQLFLKEALPLALTQAASSRRGSYKDFRLAATLLYKHAQVSDPVPPQFQALVDEAVSRSDRKFLTSFLGKEQAMKLLPIDAHRELGA